MRQLPVNSSVNIDNLRIATPCPIEWEEMTGNDQVRFCSHCQLNVYNISELNGREAAALIASTEGRLCARLFRRSDGTVLTKDCPVGLRALRLRVSKKVAAVFAAVVGVSGVIFGQQSSAKDDKTSCPQQIRITRTDAPPNQTALIVFGTVLDPNGARVAGAIVSITNSETHETRTTQASENGRFEFTSLVPGTYSVTIEVPGFKTQQINDVIVEKGKLVNIDTTVELDGQFLTGIVDIGYKVESKPTLTTVINEDMIRRLPIQK